MLPLCKLRLSLHVSGVLTSSVAIRASKVSPGASPSSEPNRSVSFAIQSLRARAIIDGQSWEACWLPSDFSTLMLSEALLSSRCPTGTKITMVSLPSGAAVGSTREGTLTSMRPLNEHIQIKRIGRMLTETRLVRKTMIIEDCIEAFFVGFGKENVVRLKSWYFAIQSPIETDARAGQFRGSQKRSGIRC